MDKKAEELGIEWEIDGDDLADSNNLSMTYQMPAELKYVIPTQFLYGRQELKKNQRKIVALLLLHVKQQRDKLYEIDPIGKAEAAKLISHEDRSQHFNEYVPSAKYLPTSSVKVIFGQDIIKKMFPEAKNLKRTVELALKAIMGRVVHEEDVDAKGNVRTKMYVIIPRAEIKKGEIELVIDHDAIAKLMVHSNGYSVTDLAIWTDLDSGYAQKLLEVLSKHKEKADGHIMDLDRFKFIFGCDYKTYTLADRERWIENGSIGERVEIGAYIYKNKKRVPLYPRFDSFRSRVLDVAFSSLINDSRGHWIPTDKPTDKDGNPLPPKGYELIRKGRTISHIKFCLKYVKNPSNKLTKKKEEADDKNEANEINDTMLSLLKQCERSFAKVVELGKHDSPSENIDKALYNEWVQNIGLYEATYKIVGYKPSLTVLEQIRTIKTLIG